MRARSCGESGGVSCQDYGLVDYHSREGRDMAVRASASGTPKYIKRPLSLLTMP